MKSEAEEDRKRTASETSLGSHSLLRGTFDKNHSRVF
jgi:hypothetical protein